VVIQKAFKYRFFPTDEQAAQLAKTFGCARYVYNQALEYRTTAWQQEKKSIGYHATAAKLTEWKKEPERAFLSEVSSVVLQQSLRNLDVAFTNFFEKRAQYPTFKSRRSRQSARYATNAFTFKDGLITLAKQSEPLDIVWSRQLPDDAKLVSLTISRDTSGRYLAKHIADAAFGEIFRELEYKANWYGRIYLPLDRFFPSSKLCSSCGHLSDELPLSVREWACPACGAHHDRDINAAINIKRAGQYLLKTTGSDARKVTPTRCQRRRSGVGIPRHNAIAFGGGRRSTPV